MIRELTQELVLEARSVLDTVLILYQFSKESKNSCWKGLMMLGKLLGKLNPKISRYNYSKQWSPCLKHSCLFAEQAFDNQPVKELYFHFFRKLVWLLSCSIVQTSWDSGLYSCIGWKYSAVDSLILQMRTVNLYSTKACTDLVEYENFTVEIDASEAVVRMLMKDQNSGKISSE